ncbi:hypothetical protein HHK36_000780 [Tetracentron sinense]|uniref:Uncharacterized protein n=1 Tax=Tetracentron sinense TaxID=13715 RepID=A0A834ZS49_TETSI|nr:hypothetical protein HHK36_000780 [Tetracentron sinense]
MLQRLQRSSRGKMERKIKKEIIVIDIWSSSDEDEDEDEEEDEEEDDGSPPRSIFCLKKSSIADIKLIEEKEDCFILDYDPFESIDISKILTISTPDDDDDDAPDLSVVSERGQVACRDYPHSRHLCVKFPFDKTPHESYCEKCYCYVCDSIAPCKSWRGYETGHCHATEHDYRWKSQRKKPETVIPQD